MPFNRLPDVDVCCGCVPDLKTASAIIAVLGIVTSPALSWAVVRHSYVIRVSCFITSSLTRPDVFDINLNNVMSFGFGPNAGLGPSCLGPPNSSSVAKPGTFLRTTVTVKETGGNIAKAVRYIGWVVLLSDLILVVCSIYFLFAIFGGGEKKAAKIFMIAALVAMILSFVYGMLYVSVCIRMGGAFPVFEFICAIVDLFVWAYFLIVVNSYRRKGGINP